MGRKERLMEYGQRLGAMYNRASMTGEAGVPTDPKEILRCQATKKDVKEALRGTRRLGRVIQEYNCSVPDQIEESAMELVLEQGKDRGFVRADNCNPYYATCKKQKREAEADKETAYYEGIIEGTIQARTGVEKVIQNITRKDAGMVLAAIGLDHPASKVVLKYLGQQKLCQIDPLRNHILKVLISHQCEKAIQKYGIPDKLYVDKGIPVQSTLQRVTRRGIRVNGKEYWDDGLLLRYLGRTVNVVVTPDVIRVEDMDESVITTFTPA